MKMPTVTTREAPWMTIGRLVDEPMTAAEAVKMGGLDFRVGKRTLYYEGRTPKNPETGIVQHVSKRYTGRIAIVNVDTDEPLGIMSKDYPTLQYREAFDFMDTVNPTYVACGALKGGRQGFLVVKAPQEMHVLGNDDPHDLFVVLRTSHDGSRAIELLVMPLRGRCMNQLTLQSFSAGVPHRWSIKHTSTMAAKLKSAQDSLQNVGEYAARFEKNAQRLVKMKITNDVATTVLESVLPDRPRRAEQVERIITSWHTSDTVGFDGTGWGLVNAVSEYYDWGRSGGSPESRFFGALQGQTTGAINRVAGRLLSRV